MKGDARAMLASVEHRPFAVPDGSWVQEHTWHDLLFAHWPVRADQLQALLPRGIEIDMHDGEAWIGVIPFRLSNIHLRGFAPLPVVSAFTELNVRTYVTCHGKPGVYFFSLDADSLFNVIVARHWYNLSYFYSHMRIDHDGESIRFSSVRRDCDSPPHFEANYRPIGDPYQAKPGSLEHWFCERYCLFAADSRGRIFCGDVHHAPWPLQKAEAEIEVNTMATPLGLKLRHTQPVLFFARKIDVLVWQPRPIHPTF